MIQTENRETTRLQVGVSLCLKRTDLSPLSPWKLNCIRNSCWLTLRQKTQKNPIEVGAHAWQHCFPARCIYIYYIQCMHAYQFHVITCATSLHSDTGRHKHTQRSRTHRSTLTRSTCICFSFRLIPRLTLLHTHHPGLFLFTAPSTTIIVSTPFPSLLRLCTLSEALPWKLANNW